jgi:hypothetical protein
MVRASKSRSDRTTLIERGSPQSGAIGPLQILQPAHLVLALKPAELEALIKKLCCCGTLRVSPGSRRLQPRRRCARPPRCEWCCLGEIAAAGAGWAETKFS